MPVARDAFLEMCIIHAQDEVKIYAMALYRNVGATLDDLQRGRGDAFEDVGLLGSARWIASVHRALRATWKTRARSAPAVPVHSRRKQPKTRKIKGKKCAHGPRTPNCGDIG